MFGRRSRARSRSTDAETGDPLQRPDHLTLTSPDRQALERYRQLVGIYTTSSLMKANKKRPTRRIMGGQVRTENHGLYRRVMNEEHRATAWYYVSASVVNISLILQILVAATITGLSATSSLCGPGASYTIPLTTLGAVNTVTAGILAYVKGQGLPNRMVQYRNQLRRVREFIEFRERQFENGVRFNGNLLDPEVEAAAAQKKYEDARKDEESNYPETYASTAESMTTNANGGVGQASGQAAQTTELAQPSSTTPQHSVPPTSLPANHQDAFNVTLSGTMLPSEPLASQRETVELRRETAEMQRDMSQVQRAMAQVRPEAAQMQRDMSQVQRAMAEVRPETAVTHGSDPVPFSSATTARVSLHYPKDDEDEMYG